MTSCIALHMHDLNAETASCERRQSSAIETCLCVPERVDVIRAHIQAELLVVRRRLGCVLKENAGCRVVESGAEGGGVKSAG